MGMTPLHLACKLLVDGITLKFMYIIIKIEDLKYMFSAKIINVLLMHGANPNLRDKNGKYLFF